MDGRMLALGPVVSRVSVRLPRAASCGRQELPVAPACRAQVALLLSLERLLHGSTRTAIVEPKRRRSAARCGVVCALSATVTPATLLVRHARESSALG